MSKAQWITMLLLCIMWYFIGIKRGLIMSSSPSSEAASVKTSAEVRFYDPNNVFVERKNTVKDVKMDVEVAAEVEVDIDPELILDQLSISDVVEYYGVTEVLDTIDEIDAIKHFGIKVAE